MNICTVKGKGGTPIAIEFPKQCVFCLEKAQQYKELDAFSYDQAHEKTGTKTQVMYTKTYSWKYQIPYCANHHSIIEKFEKAEKKRNKILIITLACAALIADLWIHIGMFISAHLKFNPEWLATIPFLLFPLSALAVLPYFIVIVAMEKLIEMRFLSQMQGLIHPRLLAGVRIFTHGSPYKMNELSVQFPNLYPGTESDYELDFVFYNDEYGDLFIKRNRYLIENPHEISWEEFKEKKSIRK